MPNNRKTLWISNCIFIYWYKAKKLVLLTLSSQVVYTTLYTIKCLLKKQLSFTIMCENSKISCSYSRCQVWHMISLQKERKTIYQRTVKVREHLFPPFLGRKNTGTSLMINQVISQRNPVCILILSRRVFFDTHTYIYDGHLSKVVYPSWEVYGCHPG